MESFEKIIPAACGVLLLAGCALFSEAPLVVVQDPLVLEEIAPYPRAVVVKPVFEYEPVYSLMRVIEVSEVDGVQKFFLARAGENRTNIAQGKGGEIADDEDFKKIIGTYTIVEVYGDIFRCEVRRLDYRIGRNAHIRMQTGERLKS
ncbi:MAG: hypothetical protein FWG35_08055 [Spirochaetaceae bacterium]|nr:hypothetical protein [Spirochaetaceae bacterium]